MTHTGLERLEAEPGLLASSTEGRKIRHAKAGLLANSCSVTRCFERSVEIVGRAVAAADGELAALFGPEHGFYGEAQAGALVADARDRRTGLPVYSLYGASRSIDPELLASLDILVVDLQDVGSRSYTYLSTIDLLVEAVERLVASGRKAPLILVLDRPNPLGGAVVEGMGLSPGFESFVGARDIPFRHGLTVGEFALLAAGSHVAAAKATGGRAVDLRVLPMTGWERRFLWPATGLPWIAPSPNLPVFDSALCYPATVLFEGTNVSEGRGTTKPFETFGAPWMDGDELARRLNALGLPGLTARPHYFTPSFSKYSGVQCGGVQLHVTDPESFRPVHAGYALLSLVRELRPDDFSVLPPPRPGSRSHIDLLCGNGLAAQGAGADEFIARAAEDENAFRKRRKPFLLYPEAV